MGCLLQHLASLRRVPACRVHSEVLDTGMDGWMEPESGQGSKEEPHTTSILSQQWVGYQKRGIRLIALVAAKLGKSHRGDGEIHHKELLWCKFNQIINFCKSPSLPFGFHWDCTLKFVCGKSSASA